MDVQGRARARLRVLRGSELVTQGDLQGPLRLALGLARHVVFDIDHAVDVLADALLLDPRRTSTWTPLGEALALSGYPEEAVACLWIGYQWSANRDKSLAFYTSQVEKQKTSKPALAQAYESVLNWVQGNKPDFKSLGK